MDASHLHARTKLFSLEVIKYFKRLPRTDEARILGKQLLRSATSVTANYRAACRARSTREFVAKLSIVVEEADETTLWLEMIVESGIAPPDDRLIQESREILYIMAASCKTARERLKLSNP